MIVDFPVSVGIASVSWTLDRPAQVNRSAYTGARSVAAAPWHGKWSARVEFAAIVGERNVRPLRAFLASLDGQVNTFQLPATEGTQEQLPAATVAVLAAKGATSMIVTGALLEPGHRITVNDQLLEVVTADGFDITFKPQLRAEAVAGTVVETGKPTCLVALATSSVSITVAPGQVYSCTIDVEEVF